MKKPSHAKRYLGTSVKFLTVCINGIMVANVPTHASDIELYKAASEGGATVMLVFDNSGSMGYNSIQEDYPKQNFDIVMGPLTGNIYCNGLLSDQYQIDDVSQDIFKNDGTTKDSSITYSVGYCKKNGTKYYDRLSRLKQALIPMLANPKQAFGTGSNFTSYNIGLAKFFSNNYRDVGVIAHPADPFDLDSRKQMIDIIKNLNAETNTPSAHAYAEVGAYMFGTTTKGIGSSGFDLAEASSKDTNNYKSPVNAATNNNEQQCGGNGIYFLTDGQPNSVSGDSAINLMNAALNKVSPIANPAGTKLTVGTNRTCDANGLSSSDSYTGWSCMGKFAQLLRNTNNPVGREIITGTAGFGSDFNDFKNATKINNKYDCSIANSQDAKNLCKLGEKGYGYGEGGFYYVETPEQLANSIVNFIAGVGNKNIPAVSTGTMSVPLDILNTDQSRGFAYTPILDPRPGTTTLWDGNLKKYFIRNSTVTADDAGTKPVFNDLTGQFSTSTYDIWNTISDATRADAQRPDKALPQVGGAFQQVFEKSGNDRNLWVNINGTLTNIKVDASTNKPSGFTALKPVLRTDLVKPTTVTTTNPDNRTPTITSILNNILVFMGYPAQTFTDMDDTTVLTGTQAKDSKNIGGVIHSVPQLVTYGVDLDSTGKFNASTRKDSVLYGSMDGALHLVDDSTGKEQFTFIPKEILDLQSDALQKGGQTTDSKLPYGVDAPWNLYTTYNISSATTGTGSSAVTTNSYAAKQIFASGGLRMGGSSYYNLDISNPSSPSMVYSVGSNYANILAGQPKKANGTVDTTLRGMQNGTLGTTGDQAAFARMGQSWGKPSVGFVRSGGKKVMVNFLPGGYDTCYEDQTFTIKTTGDNSTCAAKTQAQGNAVYMVRVGEQVEDSTTKEVKIDTSTDKGKLLWWASYGAGKDGTTTAARPTSVTLQKSEHSDMTNSIVTEIRTVDRNYDGYTDFIYFADLGGRVWRADINNNKDTDNFRVDRVVKLLDVSAEKGGTDAPPRFYERPLFTVTDEVVNGSPMAQITVGTGNRSRPVSDKRDSSKPDAIYSFIDREAAKTDLFCYKSDADCQGTATSDPYLSQSLITKNLTASNLAKLTFTASDANIKTNMMKPTMDSAFKHGWYYPFEQWYKVTGTGASAVMGNVLETTVANIQGMKMLNEPDAQNGLLFVPVYNPNVNLLASGCNATVQGATQRMLMCLPFGNCTASGYNNGTDYTKRSAALAGAGIIDNIITQSQPNVGGSKYGVLQLSCTGTSCNKSEFNKPSNLDINTINSVGVSREKVMNPREWWEK